MEGIKKDSLRSPGIKREGEIHKYVCTPYSILHSRRGCQYGEEKKMHMNLMETAERGYEKKRPIAGSS